MAIPRHSCAEAALEGPRRLTQTVGDMNQRHRYSTIFLVLGILAAGRAIPQEQPEQQDLREKYRKCAMEERMTGGYCDVSIVDLIANPQLFDDRKVLIVGYVHIEFEGRGIYLHRDDFRYGISRNALWLDGAGSVDLSKCQDSYAYVRGTFKAGIGGHFGMFTGTLEQVAACQRILPRRG